MKLLSPSQAALRMNLSTREVQRLCQAGLLPCQRVGERYVITEEAADGYVAARRGPKAKPPPP